MTAREIRVARDFSRYPAGRFRDDGPYSGEAFREDFLLPALHAGEQVVVDLDGVRGYGSSFLEEAFGGLVRKGVTQSLIKRLVLLRSVDKSLIEEVEDYIEHGAEPDQDV